MAHRGSTYNAHIIYISQGLNKPLSWGLKHMLRHNTPKVLKTYRAMK